MIRVIHYCPSINCTSGITNLIMNYYRKIDKTKVQFDFIYFSDKTDNNYEQEIIKLGGSSTYITPPNHFFSFKQEFNDYLEKIKKKYPNDDFIFQNHQLAFTIFMYRILKRNGINKIIVHNHMTKFSDSTLKAFRNMILFLPSRLMNLFYFSCSEKACDLICKFAKQDRKNIYVMNNCIDCKRFKYDEKKRERIRLKYNLSNSIVIGHIGHFERVKNHKFILKFFKKIYSINENYKLVLIGDGSLKTQIIKEIQKSEFKNNVIVLEKRSDIPDLMNAMDCFIFPSKFEGLGIVAVEAQASGLSTFISKNVPKEVMISNCIQIDTFSIDDWISHICNIRKINRELSNDIIKESKFNIDTNIYLLEKKYSEIIMSKKE